MQLRAVSAEELDNGEANWIRTSWRSRREDAMGPVIAWWFAHQCKTLRAIKYPYKKEVGEALNIGEPGLEFRQDFEHALCFMFRT